MPMDGFRHIHRALRLSCAALALCTAGVAHGQSPPEHISPHIDTELRLGSERSILSFEYFQPLHWDGKNLVFADLRFVGDDRDGREVNAGLGYRHVSEDKSFITGFYGFLDRRRSSHNNYFTQGTAGAELLTDRFEARLNAYKPLSGDKTVADITLPTTVQLAGTGIVASGGSLQLEEKPMGGFDLEAGFRLPVRWPETRLYGGVYHFDASGVEDVEGYRLRFRTKLTDWLSIGAEHMRDDVRGETNFAEIRLRLPLQHYKTREPKPQGIYARLEEPIRRDIDIVTGTQEQNTLFSEPVTNTATGEPQKVYTVDNTADPGGDGSKEQPFNTLTAAETAAGEGDIIYVRQGDGTSTGQDQGVTLGQAGQKLIGAGVDLVFDAATMEAAGITEPLVIEPATAAPVITNTNPNNDGVRVTADNVTVKGIAVDGASRDGIVVEADGAGASAQNVTISDVTAMNNRHGVYIHGTNSGSVSTKVERSFTTNNSQHGMAVYDDTDGTFTADLGGGSMGSAGLNVLASNTLEDLAVEYDGRTLAAMNNWWGQAGGPSATQLYNGAPINNGLVGHWTFDDGSGGTARDRSGNGNDGTLTNMDPATDWVAGKLSNALEFDGTGSVDLGNDPSVNNISDAITVAAWIKPDDVSTAQTILSNSRDCCGSHKGYQIHLYSNGKLRWQIWRPEETPVLVESANSLQAGQWQFMVGTFDGNALKIYVDGQFSKSINYTGQIGTPASFNLVMGRLAHSDAFMQWRWDGLIDDARIYSRALDPSEISELHRMDASSVVDTGGALAVAP